MRKYFLSPISEQDIDEIVSYIARDNSVAALKLTLMGTLRFARPTSCGIVSLLFKNGF